jgi:hypothetical protein
MVSGVFDGYWNHLKIKDGRLLKDGQEYYILPENSYYHSQACLISLLADNKKIALDTAVEKFVSDYASVFCKEWEIETNERENFVVCFYQKYIEEKK